MTYVLLGESVLRWNRKMDSGDARLDDLLAVRGRGLSKTRLPLENEAGQRNFCDRLPEEAPYFIEEKSVGCMYVESTFSTSFSVCSDLDIA